MAGYNRTREVEALLEHTQLLPPSFTVHLHTEYWTLNNGGKFLYNNQIASLLDDVRAHRIPVDFLELFDSAKVPFYNGCMVVELLDYRPQKNKEPSLETPERMRVVLHPNPETLWADLCILNQRNGGKWTDQEALDIEARILLATSPPLCLDPDPHLTRIANHVLRVSTPTVPASLKRKAAALEPEEDETDKPRRAKIMSYMAPRNNRPLASSHRLLDLIAAARQAKAVAKPTVPVPAPAQIPPPAAKAPTPQPTPIQYTASNHQSPVPVSTPTPNPSVAHAHSPAESESAKRLKAKTPVSFPKPQTPVPAQPVSHHQFVVQHPPNQGASSPIQPQVYANVQATEAAKRAATPAQAYANSPRPPMAPTPQPQPTTHPQPVNHAPAVPMQSQPSLQPHPQPPPQSQPQPPPQIQPQPQQQPRPPSVPAYQQNIANAHFLQAAAINRTVSQSQKSPVARAAQPTPPQPQQHPTPGTQVAHPGTPMLYPQHMHPSAQANLMAQHRLAQQQKNGRATPQTVPVTAASPVSGARASPIVANQTIASRSPMPQHQQPMTSHPPSHTQHLPYAQFTPLRQMVHGNMSPHPQTMQVHMANGAARVTPSPHPPNAAVAEAAKQQQQQQQQQPQQPQRTPQTQHIQVHQPQMTQQQLQMLQMQMQQAQHGQQHNQANAQHQQMQAQHLQQLHALAAQQQHQQHAQQQQPTQQQSQSQQTLQQQQQQQQAAVSHTKNAPELLGHDGKGAGIYDDWAGERSRNDGKRTAGATGSKQGRARNYAGAVMSPVPGRNVYGICFRWATLEAVA
ncbi:hypothetical protein AX16_005902 [Volvariella volvacea WC 439]|nr:hypothetical protein AX16_005902 [Volvariella volvacea WC 439]